MEICFLSKMQSLVAARSAKGKRSFPAALYEENSHWLSGSSIEGMELQFVDPQPCRRQGCDPQVIPPSVGRHHLELKNPFDNPASP